jgi:hypothetical protein
MKWTLQSQACCSLNNNIIWTFWFNYYFEHLPTSWVKDYVSISTTYDQEKVMHGILLAKGLMSLCTFHASQQALIMF